MYQFRDYQETAINRGVEHIKKKSGGILLAPTGSGKSIIGAGIAKKLNEPTLILQPSKEILEQNYSKLVGYGETDVSMYSASVNQKEISKYTYATIGSIYKVPELFKDFKYILIDECHLVDPKSFKPSKSGMYANFFRSLNNPKILGMTASPYRIVQGYAKNEQGDVFYSAKLQVLNRIHPFFFKDFVYRITNKTLFDKGWLCPLEYVLTRKRLNFDEIPLNSSGADFDRKAMESFMENNYNVDVLVNAILANNDVKHNLVFCSSIAHARKVAEVLTKFGESCDVITGLDSKDRREQVVRDFKSGKIKHLLNVGVFTTGFDFPELDCITLGRPTFSLGLYYQMVGRGIRIDPNNPNKVCRVVDVTNNVRKMGRIETIRVSKEAGSKFKYQVETEMGVISGVPLFQFTVTNKELKEKLKLV